MPAPARVRPGGPEQRGVLCEQGRVSCSLPAHGAVLALGRQVARAASARWPDCEATEAVVLVLSELLGNAVKATTGSTVALRLSWTPRRVRVEVDDDSPLPAVARHADVQEEGGRGLWLVEVVAVRWGWQVRERGKCVWAEIALTA